MFGSWPQPLIVEHAQRIEMSIFLLDLKLILQKLDSVSPVSELQKIAKSRSVTGYVTHRFCVSGFSEICIDSTSPAPSPFV